MAGVCTRGASMDGHSRQASGSVEAPSAVQAREAAMPTAGGDPPPRRPAPSSAPAEPRDDLPPGLETASLGAVMTKMLEVQERLADRVTNAKPERRSAIQVRPNIQWPILTDDDHDVEGFFDSFEETCGLANDGAGMTDAEMFKVLPQCLKGAREKTYQVIKKANLANGRVKNEPGVVYELVKARLMKFVETDYERQPRVLRELEHLQKGRLTALELEPIWERTLAELGTVGFGRSDRETLLT